MSATSTQIQAIRSGTRLVICINGRFDFGCHQAFRKAYEQVQPDDDVAVDLGRTDYLDSSALGMLLVLKDVVGGKPIPIVACRPGVRRILEIANFDRLFPLPAASASG